MTDTTAVAVTNRIIGALEGLASGLKVPAEQVWQIMVRQQQVEAIWAGLWCAVCIVVWVVWAMNVKRVYAAEKADRGDGLGTIMGSVIFHFVLFFVIGCNFYNLIIALLNPEYGALMEIAKVLR